MPFGSLKNTGPSGRDSTASTPDALSYRSRRSTMLLRSEFRVSRRILLSFHDPMSSRRRLAWPSSHPSQNAMPVGAMVGFHTASGWTGLGPLSLVPGQSELGPHP